MVNIGAARPRVSVVLPAYNAERYIAESVRSVLHQSFHDFELIVIDDGSADGTLSVLKGLALRDSRIRIFGRENRGLVATLNEGIELARGEWIARMDADDISMPDRFSRQLSLLDELEADIVGTDMKFFGTRDRRVTAHARTDAGIRIELLFGSPFCHPSVMMRVEVARSLGYEAAWEGAEDYDLWERAARAGARLANVPEVLLLYRRHPQQISSSASARQHDLSRLIQRRWWVFMSSVLGIDEAGIQAALEMQYRPRESDLDVATSTFARILAGTSGDAREIALDRIYRIYAMASTVRDTADKWRQLCSAARVDPRWRDTLLLRGLRMFPVKSGERGLAALKAIYGALNRNGSLR